MIAHTISAQVAPGKWQDAIEWTKDINAHAESLGLVTPRTWHNQYGAQTDRMLWVWEFASLAAFEEWNTALHADEGVQERIQAAFSGIFVPGSANIMALKEVV